MHQKQGIGGSWIYRALHCAAFIVAFATTTALCPEWAVARDRSATAEERQACTPDVFRLCSTRIPDADAITACLRAKFTSLSEQCRKVMLVRDTAKRDAASK